jgi:hypothetical protein
MFPLRLCYAMYESGMHVVAHLSIHGIFNDCPAEISVDPIGVSLSTSSLAT